MTTVHTLASGSSGNALLLSCGESYILLDAGISCRRITAALRELGLELGSLTAILITHTHADHISGLQTLLKRCAAPVFTTERAARELSWRLPGAETRLAGRGGLGLPIAQALMENGADIIVADLKEPEGWIGDLAKENGRRFFYVHVNLLEDDSIVKMVAEARQKTGRIDILVNAAGVNKLKKAEDYDAQTWDFVLGINLRALHLTTKEVGKLMIEQGYGRILSISSVKSLIGTDQDYIAYCASKGAVNMYTKQLACEWGKYGITVNAIAPTFTRTPINSFQLDDPAFYNKLVERIPRGRICTTKDLGCAAVYLCSDAAEFVSGQVLCVDGGLTAKQ